MINDILVIIALILVIAYQGVERFFYSEQVKRKEDRLLEENSRLIKAVMAKNANDYVMTTSIDKVAPETKPPADPDLIPEESLTDDEFMQAIHKDVKE